MRFSLIIVTYERPDALATVLGSVQRQTRLPDEVVIGDDGSGPETAAVIRRFADAGLPVRHEWLEHDGYRVGRMRNRAAAVASGDYVVIMDDDIYLHPEFVADHLAAATPGFFVQASRAILDEAASQRIIQGETGWPGPLAPGVSNRKNVIHSRFLSSLWKKPVTGIRGIHLCNFGLWREDLLRVNGFNEDFVGWGREDSEFVTRLINAGLRRRNLRFAGLGCHLYHPPRSRDRLEKNDELLAATVDSGASRCQRGINLHLGES
ncbi:MAG: glycosyltransferase family 2 protein [Planctomycetes bacterium]|nr:glycosyltransferase family 2 protein [Planctomycetota bacterium]